MNKELDADAVVARWRGYESGLWVDEPEDDDIVITTADHETPLTVARMEGDHTRALAELWASAGPQTLALCAEVKRLRAIIEGSTTPPSDAEIAAHDGRWLCAFRGSVATMRPDEVSSWVGGVSIGWWRDDEARWWPLDATGQPCAWPVVDESEGA